MKDVQASTWLRAGVAALLGVAGLGASLPALAVATAPGPAQVQVQLVASVNQVHAGEHITVGLFQHIQPGWHTYWRNPGDTGLATTIDWALPAGAVAGPIQWPVPQRFTQGGLGNYGYDHDVTLLSDLSVPATLKSGEAFPILAKVRWLACRDVCIPQEAAVRLVLPVTEPGVPRIAANRLISDSRAHMPQPAPWDVAVVRQAAGLTLRLPRAALGAAPVTSLWFYPAEAGPIKHLAEQPLHQQGPDLDLALTPGDAPLAPGKTLRGLLVVTQQEAGVPRTRGYWVHAPVQAQAPPGTGQTGSGGTGAMPAMGLGAALVLALLGGLVLNLMPCVFPVLSIKALALMKHHEHTPGQARLHGLAYTLGVLASFALLGGAMIALKAGGTQAGWGFQFQSPLFVGVVAYLMFAVGLSLSGVFTIGQSVTGVGSSLAERDGLAGSFFTGVLATVVATPCTAPFMGGAIGFALTQPAAALMAVFLSLGLGLSLPYLVLSTWPALQRRLPRPGLWMERVKQALAFPMYGAAVWLVWVLAQQAGVNAAAAALAGMVVLAFGAWSYDCSRTAGIRMQFGGAALAVLALVAALAAGYAGVRSGQRSASLSRQAGAAPALPGLWEPYSPARLQQLRAQGQPVFVDLSAAWCITCLVNEQVALAQPAVSKALKAGGIRFLRGDWTRKDADISHLLQQFGRSGVPLYVLYPAGPHSKPKVLPQVLTPDIVLAALQEARPRAARDVK